MDLFLGLVHFISDLLNNVEFIKGFFLGGLFGLIGMVNWRRNRIKELIKDRESNREYFVKEIARLKKENANLEINASAKYFNP